MCGVAKLAAMDGAYPQRRRPAHRPPLERPNQSTIVLVTVCAERRRRLLAREPAVAAILAAWRAAETWRVGRYVIMPDHLHVFCSPAAVDAPALTAWVKYWKAMATRQWPFPDELPLWQTGFWDRQLRDSRHYGERWAYVRNNPVRAGLVATPDDWPWQGEMEPFRFHDRG